MSHHYHMPYKQVMIRSVTAFTVLAVIFALLLLISPPLLDMLGLSTSFPKQYQSENQAIHIPIFKPLPTHTNQNTLRITGSAAPNTKLVLTHNDSEVANKNISETGQFEIDVSLVEGENIFSGYSVGAGGERSRVSQHHSILKDNHGPELTISKPATSQVFETEENRDISIAGYADPNTKVSLNGRLIFVNTKGEFSSTFRLKEGENILRFESIDLAGNARSKEIKVEFNP